MQEEARSLAFGRSLAAQAIVHGLDGEPAERSIGNYSWWSLRAPVVTAAGWILCEGVFERGTGRPGTRQVNGLLLARDSGVYAYQADLGRNPALAARTRHDDMTAWGRDVLVLSTDSRAAVLGCDSIMPLELNADPLHVDKAVGAIAGGLTLEDLLAGVVVRKQRLRNFPGDIPLPGTNESSAIVPLREMGSAPA